MSFVPATSVQQFVPQSFVPQQLAVAAPAAAPAKVKKSRKGVSTADLPTQIELARTTSRFIKVKAGGKTDGYGNFTTAVWNPESKKFDSGIVYSFGFRLVGKYQDIVALLTANGMPNAEAALQSSNLIHINNYYTGSTENPILHPAVLQEDANLQAVRAPKALKAAADREKKKLNGTLYKKPKKSDIAARYADGLAGRLISAVTAGTRLQGVRPTIAGSKAKSPLERLNGMTPGHYFNVSKLTALGTGAHIIKKDAVGRAHVLSGNIVSSTREGVLNAEKLLNRPGLVAEWDSKGSKAARLEGILRLHSGGAMPTAPVVPVQVAAPVVTVPTVPLQGVVSPRQLAVQQPTVPQSWGMTQFVPQGMVAQQQFAPQQLGQGIIRPFGQ